MSDINIVAPERVFKVGSVSLADPDPSLPPQDAIGLYAGSYPQVITGTLNEPTVNSRGQLVYELEKPVAKTKG